VALAIDSRKVWGIELRCRRPDRLEWQDWILIAMHDKDRSADSFSVFRIELRVHEQPNAWKEPIESPRYVTCRGEWRLQGYAAYFMVCC